MMMTKVQMAWLLYDNFFLTYECVLYMITNFQTLTVQRLPIWTRNFLCFPAVAFLFCFGIEIEPLNFGHKGLQVQNELVDVCLVALLACDNKPQNLNMSVLSGCLNCWICILLLWAVGIRFWYPSIHLCVSPREVEQRTHVAKATHLPQACLWTLPSSSSLTTLFRGVLQGCEFSSDKSPSEMILLSFMFIW